MLCENFDHTTLIFCILVLTPCGVKLLQWNNSLPRKLTAKALLELIKEGYTSADDISTMLDEEDLCLLKLTMRDRAVLRRIISQSTMSD